MDNNIVSPHIQTSIRAFFQSNQLKFSGSKKASASIPSLGSKQVSTSAAGLQQNVRLSCSMKQEARQDIFCQKRLPPSTKLPKQAAITNISAAQIQQLRRINDLLLPIAYPDSFYRKILSPDSSISFSRAVVWSDPEPKVVGAIVCRLDLSTPHPVDTTGNETRNLDNSNDVYIQSLSLLSPYRGMGLATNLLREVMDIAIKHQELRIGSLYAHVWTDNKDALDWYLAQGFQREENVIHGYYRQLKPDTAWVLRRKLSPTDYITNLPFNSSPKQVADSKLEKPLAQRQLDQSHLSSNTCSSTRSFQDKGPEMEWNDLPSDVIIGNSRSRTVGNVKQEPASSELKSRIEIGNRKKKTRVYPSAAFGI